MIFFIYYQFILFIIYDQFMSIRDPQNYSGSILKYSKEQLSEISSDLKKLKMEDDVKDTPSGLKTFVNPKSQKKKSIPARIGFKKKNKKTSPKINIDYKDEEKEVKEKIEEDNHFEKFDSSDYQDDVSQSISHYLNEEDLESFSEDEERDEDKDEERVEDEEKDEVEDEEKDEVGDEEKEKDEIEDEEKDEERVEDEEKVEDEENNEEKEKDEDKDKDEEKDEDKDKNEEKDEDKDAEKELIKIKNTNNSTSSGKEQKNNNNKETFKLDILPRKIGSKNKSKSSETLLSNENSEEESEEEKVYYDFKESQQNESSSLKFDYEDDKDDEEFFENRKEKPKKINESTTSISGFLDEDNSFLDPISNDDFISFKKSSSLDFDNIMKERIKRRQKKEKEEEEDEEKDDNLNFVFKAKSLPNINDKNYLDKNLEKNKEKNKDKKNRRNTIGADNEFKKSSSLKIMKEREKRLDDQKLIEIQKLKELEEKERIEREKAKRYLVQLRNKKKIQQSKIENIEFEISKRQSRKINETQFFQKLLVDNFQEYKHLRQFEPSQKCIQKYLEIKLNSKKLHDTEKLVLFNIMCKDILNVLTIYEIIGLLETGFTNFKNILKTDNQFKMNVYQIFQKNYSEKIQLLISHILHILINSGFDFNKYFQDMFIIRPLSFCMIKENNLIAYFLIKNHQVIKNEINNPIYKFQVKKLDEKISTLGLAVIHQNIDGIKLLLIHGANINVRKKDYYRNEIRIAKKKKFKDIVKLL